MEQGCKVGESVREQCVSEWAMKPCSLINAYYHLKKASIYEAKLLIFAKINTF